MIVVGQAISDKRWATFTIRRRKKWNWKLPRHVRSDMGHCITQAQPIDTRICARQTQNENGGMNDAANARTHTLRCNIFEIYLCQWAECVCVSSVDNLFLFRILRKQSQRVIYNSNESLNENMFFRWETSKLFCRLPSLDSVSKRRFVVSRPPIVVRWMRWKNDVCTDKAKAINNSRLPQQLCVCELCTRVPRNENYAALDEVRTCLDTSIDMAWLKTIFECVYAGDVYRHTFWNEISCHNSFASFIHNDECCKCVYEFHFFFSSIFTFLLHRAGNKTGDIDDCIVTPTVQGQFTPLPEALCDVIMDLTSQGQSATIENIRVKLSAR